MYIYTHETITVIKARIEPITPKGFLRPLPLYLSHLTCYVQATTLFSNSTD